tara:strand:- start:701 stop:1852 length:1152 start_codon:yes stop_codon:yes gene_type:complete
MAKKKAGMSRQTIDDKMMGPEPAWVDGDITTENYSKELNWGLRWYNYYWKPKQYVKPALKYAKDVLNYSKKDIDSLKKLKDWQLSLTPGPGRLAQIALRGFPSDQFADYLKDKYDECLLLANEIIAEEKEEKKQKAKKPVISPAERMRMKVVDTIMGDFDEMVVDSWMDDVYDTEFDTYTLLKKHDIKGTGLNIFKQRVEEYHLEISDAYDKKCDQAVEAYSHVKRTNLRKMKKQLKDILSDIEKIRMAQKQTRKPRAHKAKASDKQVEKLQYCKENVDAKLASINPVTIPGAQRLYMFNIKNKKLTEFVSNSSSGFEVSGTSLKNFDPALSRCVTLRKPDDVIPGVMTKTVKQIDNLWKNLTTKTTQPTARINNDCILLRVL